jgi:hypothetical protein
MLGQFMNDSEKDEEVVVTYFTKQYRNVPRMTTVEHKKTENNWPPGSPNRGPGVPVHYNGSYDIGDGHNVNKETSVF